LGEPSNFSPDKEKTLLIQKYFETRMQMIDDRLNEALTSGKALCCPAKRGNDKSRNARWEKVASSLADFHL